MTNLFFRPTNILILSCVSLKANFWWLTIIFLINLVHYIHLILKMDCTYKKKNP